MAGCWLVVMLAGGWRRGKTGGAGAAGTKAVLQHRACRLVEAAGTGSEVQVLAQAAGAGGGEVAQSMHTSMHRKAGYKHPGCCDTCAANAGT